MKNYLSKQKMGGSGEQKADDYGHSPKQHQKVVSMGQGPSGNVAAIVPWGKAPPVPPPPVGAGKGFKGI